MDNMDIAILTKLNDLAERRGLKPYDFLAEVNSDADSTVLRFADAPGSDDRRIARFSKMLEDLGIGDDGELKGDDSFIIDALDHALEVSPRRRF